MVAKHINFVSTTYIFAPHSRVLLLEYFSRQPVRSSRSVQPFPSKHSLAYLVLHWTLLPSYPVLPHPTLTQSNYPIQPSHPTRLLLPSYPIHPTQSDNGLRITLASSTSTTALVALVLSSKSRTRATNAELVRCVVQLVTFALLLCLCLSTGGLVERRGKGSRRRKRVKRLRPLLTEFFTRL